MKETQYQKYLKQVKRSEIFAFACNFIVGFVMFGIAALFTYYNYFNKQENFIMDELIETGIGAVVLADLDFILNLKQERI